MDIIVIDKGGESLRFGKRIEIIIDTNEQTAGNVNSDEPDLCADHNNKDNNQTENITYSEQNGTRPVETQSCMSDPNDYSTEKDGKSNL